MKCNMSTIISIIGDIIFISMRLSCWIANCRIYVSMHCIIYIFY
jgi:hypothetical protein